MKPIASNFIYWHICALRQWVGEIEPDDLLEAFSRKKGLARACARMVINSHL